MRWIDLLPSDALASRHHSGVYVVLAASKAPSGEDWLLMLRVCPEPISTFWKRATDEPVEPGFEAFKRHG